MSATNCDCQKDSPLSTPYEQVEMLTQSLRLLISAQLQSIVDLVWTRYELLVVSGLPQEQAVEVALERLPRYRYLQALRIEGFDFDSFSSDLQSALEATLDPEFLSASPREAIHPHHQGVGDR